MEDKLDLIKDVINNMNEAEMVDVHNSYCFKSHNEDDWIYHIDDFDSMYADMSPSDIAGKVVFGDWHPCDEWWTFDAHADVQSIAYVPNYIRTDDIADYAIDNDFDFGYPAIRDILDGLM